MSSVDELAADTAALRKGAGAFRSARDVLAVRGPDAEEYLQGQLSQDVLGLAVGASADSLLLEPDGKLSALLRVTRTDGQGFVLDVDAGYGDAVVARLRRFLLRAKVEIGSARLALPVVAWHRCRRGGRGLAHGPGRAGRARVCRSSGTAGAASTCWGRPTWCSARRAWTSRRASWRAARTPSRPVASFRACRRWVPSSPPKTIPHEAGVVRAHGELHQGVLTRGRSWWPVSTRAAATCRGASWGSSRRPVRRRRTNCPRA